jgi:hypothetical protein
MKRLALLALCALLAPAASAASSVLPFNTVVTTVTWDDNLSNADADADRVADVLVGIRFALDQSKPVNGSDRVRLQVQLDLQEAWDHAKAGESRLGGGLGWERKFGLGPDAPVLGVGLGLDAVVSRDSRRNGLLGAVNLTGRFRLANPTTLEVAQSFTRRRADHDLFESRARESALTLRHDLAADWQLVAGARWRQGEVVSFATPPRPDLVGLATVIVPLDPTFGNTRTAYAVDARALSGSLTLSRRLSQNYALAVGHEHRTTRRGPLDYTDRRWQLSLSREL